MTSRYVIILYSVYCIHSEIVFSSPNEANAPLTRFTVYVQKSTLIATYKLYCMYTVQYSTVHTTYLCHSLVLVSAAHSSTQSTLVLSSPAYLNPAIEIL